jgi:hypothetical protein
MGRSLPDIPFCRRTLPKYSRCATSLTSPQMAHVPPCSKMRYIARSNQLGCALPPLFFLCGYVCGGFESERRTLRRRWLVAAPEPASTRGTCTARATQAYKSFVSSVSQSVSQPRASFVRRRTLQVMSLCEDREKPHPHMLLIIFAYPR